MAPTLIHVAYTCLVTLLSAVTLAGAASVPQKRDVSVPTDLPGSWVYKGCYTDSVGARTLGAAWYGDGSAMTVEACISFCSNDGYVYAGTEYSSECYCDDALGNGGTNATDNDCNMACSGNSSEACGGPNRLSLFYNGGTVPTGPVENPGTDGWSSLGCYTDATGDRTLGTFMPTTNLTVAVCISACASNSYIYAGVEYAGECYCGNTIGGAGAPATSGCSMTCNGNSSETCGGPNRLNLYTKGKGGTSSSAAPGVTASTTATSSKTSNPISSTISAVPTGLPTGWTYKGCYIDNANGRILNNQQNDNSKMTIESCVALCAGDNYTVAGMEYGVQCFCDDFLRNGGVNTSEPDCSMACGGNSAEKCGAGNRMSIYSTGNLEIYKPPAAQNTSLPGSWQYKGCIMDNGDERVFPYELILSNNNSAKTCLTQCSNFGYPAGGMEYSEECYCGDPSNVVSSGTTFMPESDCNMPCTGNSSYICGGGDRISYYEWVSESEPLYVWNTPSGAGMGQYEFLIGGVVIPLVTCQGTNGKVTFLEKFGTGAPNTTGAYEFDPAEVVNGINATWRPMHVKSDIFCSASLVLPDKVGRQINVGGWALGSTYGVRLYWPDGSPGEPSTNDWQENVDEIALQVGRWYPSAMIMQNGSILVVGGEEGSNGAPVPSLEILPKPPGGYVLYCDWLNRTDPYNLYPYLAVLPSGGIFVGYYNEARILDAGTLQTIKTLPNIPGAVNDFLGGRSYPFEGTAMLMPQYAPYSDPLKIMICGGSVPGPEIALDNCVTIAPDASEPEWAIERMPSKRVITCMTALPDGTYLILNGAHQGRAGFGTGSDPNLNAVLYDPSQPVGRRMSIMANTTIARMYHSEAILLSDGRILVSGSDPEDPRYPQEYRVEVFMPPYLLSGAARPSYTISNKDWSYSESVTITVTSSTSSNLRVSLLGMEASTHGNSMGQRTIFPAISCSGSKCTITAPPNANVCPPGWFQLFLLDGPTPSHSQFVRIGGDPAGLGNWPDFPDFTVPGV